MIDAQTKRLARIYNTIFEVRDIDSLGEFPLHIAMTHINMTIKIIAAIKTAKRLLIKVTSTMFVRNDPNLLKKYVLVHVIREIGIEPVNPT